ncbi:MAG: agmatinase [Candidatus Micrarchaeaceae archaeon]
MKLLNSMPPHNLFGIEDATYETAKIVAIPVPYDSTVTYKSGTRDGPDAIIDASRNIELYSADIHADISKIGIFTTEPLAPDFDSPKGMVDRIAKEVSFMLDDGKVPILLGGEHTIGIGGVQALAGKGMDFSILHFDAHSDSREEMFGTSYCHGTVISRMREVCDDYYSIGVRSVNEESANDKRISYMHDIRFFGIKEVARKINKLSSDNIYITFDFDVLDPSEMPSVGTPEPDGFRFSEIQDFFMQLIYNKNVIGMDFTELSPIPGLAAPNYLAAKLIYNLIGIAYVLPKQSMQGHI